MKMRGDSKWPPANATQDDSQDVGLMSEFEYSLKLLLRTYEIYFENNYGCT